MICGVIMGELKLRDKMNKVIFVTGASRGIGRGIADRFLEEGFRVAVGYCNHPVDVADFAPHPSERILSVKVDVHSRKSLQEAMGAISDHFACEVDVLVNNAAMAQEKPFLEITDNDWDHMLAVNLRGPFVAIQEVLPAMRQKGWGRIINISSIGGQWGGFNQVHYAAAKAGLINLTRSVAKLFSAEGITCNAVAPGLVATDMAAIELGSETGLKKVQGIPVGRIATIDEVSSAVCYLASDEASYITGQTVNVNGGMYFG
jgi:NAD(P)-dependent dehydrogenase (short-subunit alcohol dehydrogenase family)